VAKFTLPLQTYHAVASEYFRILHCHLAYAVRSGLVHVTIKGHVKVVESSVRVKKVEFEFLAITERFGELLGLEQRQF
jgi:hypothetical protein